MKKSLSFFIFCFTLLSLEAKAALLVEPLLGHNFSVQSNVHGEGRSSGGNGLGYGGRISFQKLGFIVGADYLHSNLDMNDSDYSDKLKTNEYAGVVGFKFPILLKVYGGYIVNATGTTDFKSNGMTTSQSARFNSGHGYKLGAGWTVFPLIDINLEYRSLTFDDWKAGGVKNNSNVDLSAWLVSVSVPFKIFE